MNLISVGEVLWDVIGEKEYLGGAPFNFAAHLSRLGHNAFFVGAVGADRRGERILEEMSRMGLSTRWITRVEGYPTGTVTVTLDAGQPHFVIHRPAAYDFPKLSDAELGELLGQGIDWIYFGTLLQMSPVARELTLRILDSSSGARRFYDVNLRTNSYQPSLVRDLFLQATVVKLNEREVSEIAHMFGTPYASLEEFCRTYAGTFGWEAVCVSCGSQGSVLWSREEQYVKAKGYLIEAVDPVGAGDAFAAAVVHGLSAGWSAREIADFANRVGALVASRQGAVPCWTAEEVWALSIKP